MNRLRVFTSISAIIVSNHYKALKVTDHMSPLARSGFTASPYAALPICLSLISLTTALPAQAESSIWYKDGNPLNVTVPAAISSGYVGNTACAAPNLQNALTLGEVADATLCNNPQTREAWANARVQAAQVGIARSAYLPSVTDTVGTNINVTSPELATRNNAYSNLSNSIVASYLLYDFGNRDATLESARQLLQAASATQDVTVQTLLLSAVQAYYQVQANIAALDASREAERASEESFKAADARYKAGVATPADKLQAQTAYAQATLSRITAEGNLKTAYGTLANVMGIQANQPIRLVNNTNYSTLQPVSDDIDALIEQARNRRPDLMASEAQVKAAQASIDASKAAAKPTVSIAMSNSQQDGSSLTSANTSTLGLTVSIPLFSGYAPTYRIRSAEATREVRAAQRDRIRLQISLDVWNAYQNLRTANESVIAAQVLVQSAEESSRVALGRYKAGVGNIIDTLNAQSALASAKQQLIQAYLNGNVARATLAQAVGVLDNAMIQTLPDQNNP
ncbi:TolC family type I secretion outer membrane protein [Methylovorus glucosotrophus]|nr:TolC family type I secretion outer membrane protein [Methylovorus glucosotrophus]